jgi:hypothetical protein
MPLAAIHDGEAVNSCERRSQFMVQRALPKRTVYANHSPVA